MAAHAAVYFYFNPRAPCGARQSRATASIGVSSHFNPRAPCGARPAYTVGVPGRERISIHAPRAGRDFQCFDAAAVSAGFQSTRPVRGATRSIPCRNSSISHFNPRAPCGARLGPLVIVWYIIGISIHAPRAGRDLDPEGQSRRLPGFQSTRPVRGATTRPPCPQADQGISIHAPRAGRDPRRSPALQDRQDFNPRAPCGARRSRAGWL